MALNLLNNYNAKRKIPKFQKNWDMGKKCEAIVIYSSLHSIILPMSFSTCNTVSIPFLTKWLADLRYSLPQSDCNNTSWKLDCQHHNLDLRKDDKRFIFELMEWPGEFKKVVNKYNDLCLLMMEEEDPRSLITNTNGLLLID